jgi:hypothetical protein
MQHQHAGGDVALGRAQPRFVVCVETLKNLKLGYIRRLCFCGRIEIELAFFDALHNRSASDRLRGPPPHPRSWAPNKTLYRL